MDYEILSTLYNSTRSLSNICPGLSVGSQGPTGAYLSALRPSTRAAKPKINCAAVVLEYIVTGRLAVIEHSTSSEVYCEFYKSGSTTPDIYYIFSASTNKCHTNVSAPDGSSVSIIPAVAFAISSHSNMPETKKIFETCIEEYSDNSTISQASLFKFCEEFYYEWKQYNQSKVEWDEFIMLDLVKQGIRTGTLQRIPLLDRHWTFIKDVTIESFTSIEEEERVIKDKYLACQSGDYKIDYFWDLSAHEHIPKLAYLDDFVPCDEFFSMLTLISTELNKVIRRLNDGAYGTDAIKDNYVNSILVGKPGTGKTTLAYALGSALGMPVMTVPASKNVEEDTFTGKTVVSEGGFKFVPTPFLDVYKNGGIILLEEFNLSDPAVMMGAIGQAIEKPFILLEDGYKEVRRHPLCVVISTMNTATQGSREPSEAFTSRSPDVYMLDDPDKDQFLAILMKRGYAEKNCRRVYNAYTKVISHLTSSSVNAEDVALSITMRHCFAALRQMENGEPFKKALKNTIIGTIAIKDLALAKEVNDTVIEPMV